MRPREKQSRVRLWLGTLSVSLLLHAALLFVRCGDAPRLAVAPRPAEVAEQEPIEFELEVPARTPPRPTPPPTRPQQQQRSVKPQVRTDRDRSGSRGASVEIPPLTPTSTSQSDAPLASAQPTVTPNLVPSMDALPFKAGGGSAPGFTGQTVTNGLGEEPDPDAVAEYTAETLKRRLDGELRAEAGAAAARNGMAPRYFIRMHGALDDALEKTPVELTHKPAKERLVDALRVTVLEPAGRYGATGNPYASPEDARDLQQSGLGRTAERGSPQLPNEQMKRDMNATMQSLGAFDATMKSAQRARLEVVIGLEQDWSGALAEVRVVRPSKDPEFDQWVIHLTRKVFREKGERDPEADELPTSTEGWYSEWRVTWEPPKVKSKLLRFMRGPAPERPH